MHPDGHFKEKTPLQGAQALRIPAQKAAPRAPRRRAEPGRTVAPAPTPERAATPAAVVPPVKGAPIATSSGPKSCLSMLKLSQL